MDRIPSPLKQAKLPARRVVPYSVSMDDTVVLATVVGAREAKPAFFPLTVDYV